MKDTIRKTPKEIGKIVRNYFKDNDISQDAVACELGFSSSHVVANQLGGKRFGLNTAEKYAKAFGFSEFFLLTGKGELIPNDKEFNAILSAKNNEIENLEKENQKLKTEIEEMKSTIVSQQETLHDAIKMLTKKSI